MVRGCDGKQKTLLGQLQNNGHTNITVNIGYKQFKEYIGYQNFYWI